MPSDLLSKERRSKVTLTKRRALVLAAALIIFLYFFFGPASSEPVVATRFLLTTPHRSTQALFILDTTKSHNEMTCGLKLEDPSNLLSSTSDFFLSHITPLARAGSVYVVTNEVQNGSVLKVRVRASSESDECGARATLLAVAPTGGDEPCFAIVDRTSRYLIVVNYGSPTVSIIRLSDFSLQHTLIVPRNGSISHPHHVVLHPTRKDVVFVTDLGQNLIHTLEIDRNRLEYQDTWSSGDGGPKGIRHGVFDHRRENLYLTYQNSAAILSVPFHSSLGDPSYPSVSTLPPSLSSLDGKMDASDIHVLPSGLIVTLNRQISPPFPSLQLGELSRAPLGGDTLAMFTPHEGGGLVSQGHVELGCYQPREILDVSVDGAEAVMITCVGGNGQHPGVRRVEFGRDELEGLPLGRVTHFWETDSAVMGIAPWNT